MSASHLIPKLNLGARGLKDSNQIPIFFLNSSISQPDSNLASVS
jgi:hypothetical protein